jgi:hypothetical protein
MFFCRGDNLLSECRPGTESEVTELHIVRRFYTYFGWFPWKDFEGESFSEGKVRELTAGQAGTRMSTVVAGVEADSDEESEPLI